MGYTSGAKIIYDILDEIRAALIASSGGYWSDGDAAWNTSNKTDGYSLGRRCLKYQNGSEVIYWAFEVVNVQSYFWSGQYGRGIRVTASQTWDSVNHTYPVSNQATFCAFESHSTTNTTNLATLQCTYYLWTESNGFVLMFKPEPTGMNAQQSVVMIMERNPNKEYSDGYSNFYLMTLNNIWGNLYGQQDIGYPHINLSRCILRPFAYQYPDGGGSRVQSSSNGNGISYVANPTYYAFKSNGNGKVYYVKPIINNTANQLAPIFQAELWFPWSESVGLVDGDVVAIEGSTTKFLCKALDSPDSASRLCYAIKYVA
jgi:hypothetical protein